MALGNRDRVVGYPAGYALLSGSTARSGNKTSTKSSTANHQLRLNYSISSSSCSFGNGPFLSAPAPILFPSPSVPAPPIYELGVSLLRRLLPAEPALALSLSKMVNRLFQTWPGSWAASMAFQMPVFL